MEGQELPRWSAELVLDAQAMLGESPYWDLTAEALVWVDIMAGAVHVFEPRSGLDRAFTVGQPVGAAVPRAAGGYVLALRDGLAVVDGESGPLRWLAELERDEKRTRMNDAACDAHGRFWAGTMDLAEREPLGSLYRLSPQGAVETLLTGVTVSNGLDWSPDGDVLYHIDSPRLTVEAYTLAADGHTLVPRGTVVRFEPGCGEPDGLTVDAEGCLWVALWDGWSLRRYRPDGTLVGVLELPVARVTNSAFGGAALDTLYVTTARPDEPDERQPHAGGVFAAHTGVRGRPAHRFGG